jgi:hypothetical protein
MVDGRWATLQAQTLLPNLGVVVPALTRMLAERLPTCSALSVEPIVSDSGV